MTKALPYRRPETERVCPGGNCPPDLVSRIQHDFDRCKLLAQQGLWTEAAEVFRHVREACLSYQPSTVDPFELPWHETALNARARSRLEAIGVFCVGQVGNVPRAELAKLGLGPKGREQLTEICRIYDVPLALGG